MNAIDELFQAVDANDRMAVERLLRQQPQLQTGARRERRTPLHAAVEKSMATTVLALLQHGSELNARVDAAVGTADPRTGYTALHLAVERGNRQILELLLAQPALDMGARTPDGESAVRLAEQSMRPALADMILERIERSRPAPSPSRAERGLGTSERRR